MKFNLIMNFLYPINYEIENDVNLTDKEKIYFLSDIASYKLYKSQPAKLKSLYLFNEIIIKFIDSSSIKNLFKNKLELVGTSFKVMEYLLDFYFEIMKHMIIKKNNYMEFSNEFFDLIKNKFDESDIKNLLIKCGFSLLDINNIVNESYYKKFIFALAIINNEIRCNKRKIMNFIDVVKILIIEIIMKDENIIVENELKYIIY